MAKWLTQEWFDETRAMVADLPWHPDCPPGLQFEVTGGPEARSPTTGRWRTAAWPRAPKALSMPLT